MFIKISFLFILVISFLKASETDKLESIILNSEINKRIENINTILNNYTKNFSDNQYINNFKKNYKQTVIKEEIKDELDFILNDNEIEEINTWYNSELGIKIKSLNEIIITEEKAKELFIDTKAVHNKVRLEKISEIEKKLQISAYDFEIFKTLTENLLLVKKTKDLNSSQIYINNNLEKLKNKMKEQSLVFLNYKYKILSYEELVKYNEFLSSETTQKFIKAYREKLLESIRITFELSIKES